jgi:phosphatidate cytidylyltransferase
MLVAPKRSEEESVHPKGLFESKMLALGARALGYTWIGTAVGAAAAMLRMDKVCIHIYTLTKKHGPGRLVATVVATAIGDTMGYFVGRAFGRSKAVPGLSPNKTVEGLMGHVFLAPLPLIIAAKLPHIFGSWATDWMPYAMQDHIGWVALFGSLIAGIGAIGDLAESVCVFEGF